MNTSDTLLTVPEVAARLRVSRPTIYRRIAEGSLRAVRVGREIGPLRVFESDVEGCLHPIHPVSPRSGDSPAERRAPDSSRPVEARQHGGEAA